MDTIIEAKDLIKSFKNGDTETRVLKGVNFAVKKGEFVAMVVPVRANQRCSTSFPS
jgi:ABC-type lipoprotein export system ATPase subunit